MITKTSTAALLAGFMVAGMSSAAFADCGVAPKAPTIPPDGNAASSKDMEAASKDLETYSDAFAKYNECSVKEYNTTMDTWQKTLTDYQNKNKKKK